MNDLSNEKIYKFLSEPLQVSEQEIQLAYDAFIDQTTMVCMTEKDNSKVFRILHYQILMFESLQSSLLSESGGGRLEKSLSEYDFGLFKIRIRLTSSENTISRIVSVE